ncbi:MAG TPA: tetratricopeptide repeat protein, partial [Burkholderiaceae bacterium]|nr:tetratricopeptide repeat protein [Burkholderiaceae bacterium]
QVEGLPLALELAAAWTRVLPCDAIAAELRHGTELLHAVDHAQPARHASIEVVFEQSWRLLNAIERDALTRLSVFHGGFTADAARGVAAASLPVLAALTDKSLLRKEGARLFMHPLVHHLAALRLPNGAAREAAERAHALYFQQLMEQLRRNIENGNRESLQRLDIEFENCRAAWRWSIKSSAAAGIIRSAPTLFYFCDHRGRHKEGVALLREPLESQPNRVDAGLEALLLSEIAHLEYRLDRYADAEATATRALAIAKTARSHSAQALALQVLASCHLRMGRLADAKRTFEHALRQALAASDPRKAGVMLHNQAVVARAAGQREEAQRLFSEAMAQHKVVGDTPGEALCLTNLALLLSERGELDSAVAHLNTALTICERHGFVHTQALVLSNLSDLSMKRGDHASALTQAQRALEASDAIGNRNMVGWSRLQFLRLALVRGDFRAARAELAASLTIGIAIGRPSLLLAGVGCFAEILAAQGEADCARLLLNFAQAHPSTNPSDRDEFRERMAGLPPASDVDLAWPGIELNDLVQRIVIESGVEQAPLLTAIRGTLVH